MVVSEAKQEHTASGSRKAEAMPWWSWGYRLLRVAVMVVLAFWLSRNGDAFFYQGF